ncbi:MAG: TIGR03084 family protein [Rhizobiaceae bacterium]|nr:TIGR03084 family protein [Rhizobiaceae bacterium]
MQQAEDFRAECDCLAEVIAEQTEDIFQRTTLFNSWTINDIIGHLHMFNVAARLTLENDQKFADFFAPVAADLKQGRSMREAQYVWLNGLEGRPLFDAWREGCQATADLYALTDPRQRIKWAGPDMSARSSITARQMETWAHGQEVFDCLGMVRPDTDRIKNIAHLGVQTFGWTFINRQLPVPEPVPHVVLTAPSGAVWTWNEPQEDNQISGKAVEFGQVVTQTRNVADTSLVASGDIAAQWMAIAQCFAGAPIDPPAPGQRFMVAG